MGAHAAPPAPRASSHEQPWNLKAPMLAPLARLSAQRARDRVAHVAHLKEGWKEEMRWGGSRLSACAFQTLAAHKTYSRAKKHDARSLCCPQESRERREECTQGAEE